MPSMVSSMVVRHTAFPLMYFHCLSISLRLAIAQASWYDMLLLHHQSLNQTYCMQRSRKCVQYHGCGHTQWDPWAGERKQIFLAFHSTAMAGRTIISSWQDSWRMKQIFSVTTWERFPPSGAPKALRELECLVLPFSTGDVRWSTSIGTHAVTWQANLCKLNNYKSKK